MNEQKKKSPIKIIPLGGVGEIGKNMTVIEFENDILVIDCGLIFPREDMLGIDYIIPDTTYLEKNIDKIKAILITHGHEDHIGGTPYILPKINVPVYGSELSLVLIEAKQQEHVFNTENFHKIKEGETFTVGKFTIEAIKVNHSIDGALAYAIHTRGGTVIHTGDFKVDYSPVDGKKINLQKFAELGKRGVLALLSDSTNAESPGYTLSEALVGVAFDSFFKEAKGRIIVATFASNIHRLQQVADTAKRYNRKICFAGRSMIKIAGIAKEYNYLTIDDDTLIDINDIKNLPSDQVVILTTGSQGETMSGLVRMAAGEHPKIKIAEGDMIIISSSPIPGNERYVSDVINMLHRKGAIVVNEASDADIHVSGHACQEELKLILSLTQPKYFIPVHGEYRHLYAHAELARKLGMNEKNIFVPELGHSIDLYRKNAMFAEYVSAGSVLIDGLGVGDIGNVVLRDRKVLSQDGLFVVIVTLSKESGDLISGPELISRGFVYVKESENLMELSKQNVIKSIIDCKAKGLTEWSQIKGKIKRNLRDFLYEKTQRNPMILPVIIEI